MSAHQPSPCPFLDLPTELRLIIYDYALTECPVITIGCAELVGDHPDIVQRLYANSRTPFPGIPPNNEPIIETGYEPSLLSPVRPAIIPLSPHTSLEPDEVFQDPHLAHRSLLLVCRRVHSEVRGHLLHPDSSSSRARTRLFVQYPYGLHVMRSSAPDLLRRARSVHLAGTYRPHAGAFCPQRAAYFGPLVIQNQAQDHGPGAGSRDSTAQLAGLVKAIFGGGGGGGSEQQQQQAAPNLAIEAFEMRVYYPGEDSYSTVWGDDASPTLVALKNIGAARICLEVWRGRFGTGIYLCARPSLDDRRVVSTVWRRLEEGRRHQPPCGSWVVDEKWPDWVGRDDDYHFPHEEVVVA